MSVLYIKKWSEIVAAGHSKYVYSEKIDAGKILHVHNCYAHAPERDANDIIQLGVERGGEKVLIRSRGGAIAKEGMSALRDFFVGEGNRVFGYFPDSEDDDQIELHIVGHLLDIEEWRAGKWA